MKKLYNVTNGTWHLEVSVEELSILLIATQDQREKMMKGSKKIKNEELKKWLEEEINMTDKMLEEMKGAGQ